MVSLASALSVPLLTPLGQPFPHRNLLLFITFVVILVTLVVQGLTLPWLIRKVNLSLEHPAHYEAEQELFIQQQLAQQARRFAETQAGLAHEYARNLQVRLALDNQFLLQAMEGEDGAAVALHQYVALLQRQRALLHELNQRPDFDEEIIRKYLNFLDLEEHKLREMAP